MKISPHSDFFCSKILFFIKYRVRHVSIAEVSCEIHDRNGRTGARFRNKKIVTKIVMRIVMRCNFDSETCLNFSSHEFFK